MCFFNKVVRAEIIGRQKGISESDALSNYAAGHMMGGFDGMVHSYFLNKNRGPSTTFLITYKNGKTKVITVLNDSFDYRYYMQFVF